MKAKREHNTALYEAILALKTPKECIDFFEDLCTVGELSAMEQRYQVAVLLERGLIYNDILEQTGASSATKPYTNQKTSPGLTS